MVMHNKRLVKITDVAGVDLSGDFNWFRNWRQLFSDQSVGALSIKPTTTAAAKEPYYWLNWAA